MGCDRCIPIIKGMWEKRSGEKRTTEPTNQKTRRDHVMASDNSPIQKQGILGTGSSYRVGFDHLLFFVIDTIIGLHSLSW